MLVSHILISLPASTGISGITKAVGAVVRSYEPIIDDLCSIESLRIFYA